MIIPEGYILPRNLPVPSVGGFVAWNSRGHVSDWTRI